MSTAHAFHDRLLEFLPRHTEPGQRIARLDPAATAADDEAMAWALADRACRAWLRGAIPPHPDVLDACVYGLEWFATVSDPSTAMEAVELARDTRRIIGPFPGGDEIVATARLAEAVARAAARHEHAAAGRAAADCLLTRRANSGDDYIVDEATAVLAAP